MNALVTFAKRVACVALKLASSAVQVERANSWNKHVHGWGCVRLTGTFAEALTFIYTNTKWEAGRVRAAGVKPGMRVKGSYTLGARWDKIHNLDNYIVMADELNEPDDSLYADYNSADQEDDWEEVDEVCEDMV